MDQIALEEHLSKLLTSDNFAKASAALGKINPVAGMAVGLAGALIARAAANVEQYIANQWNAAIVPPDVIIPMQYRLAVQFLKTNDLSNFFKAELEDAERLQADLEKMQEARNQVSSIASVMAYVMQVEGQKSLASAVFVDRLATKDFRGIWEQFEDYQMAVAELARALPSPEIRSILQIAFPKESLKGIVTDAVKSEAGTTLATSIQDFVKKTFSYDIDISDLLKKIA